MAKIAALLFFAASQGVFGQSTWTPRNSGTANGLASVIWTGSTSSPQAGGQLVAVGANGTILTSPDGITWARQKSGTSNALNSITWTGCQLVAVGSGGTILTSPDGLDWTAQVSGTTNNLGGVTWACSSKVSTNLTDSGTKQIVAVGVGGTILTSPNGRIWTAQRSGTSEILYSVAWTGALLVTVGDFGTIVTSPDGVTWTKQLSAARNGSRFVTWTGSTISPQAGDQLMAVHYDAITSPDGIIWAMRGGPTSAEDRMLSVTWSGSQFVAVGVIGMAYSGLILTSPNGVNWTYREPGITGSLPSWYLGSVAWTGRLFVVVGQGGSIQTSPQDPASVMPFLSGSNRLAIRQTSFLLFATLPNSLIGPNMRAAIYRVSGNKVVEVRATDLSGGFQIPINGLAHGAYLLKVNSPAAQFTRPFSVAR